MLIINANPRKVGRLDAYFDPTSSQSRSRQERRSLTAYIGDAFGEVGAGQRTTARPAVTRDQ